MTFNVLHELLCTEKINPSGTGIERMCNYNFWECGRDILEVYDLSEVKSYLSQLHTRIQFFHVRGIAKEMTISFMKYQGKGRTSQY